MGSSTLQLIKVSYFHVFSFSLWVFIQRYNLLVCSIADALWRIEFNKMKLRKLCCCCCCYTGERLWKAVMGLLETVFSCCRFLKLIVSQPWKSHLEPGLAVDNRATVQMAWKQQRSVPTPDSTQTVWHNASGCFCCPIPFCRTKKFFGAALLKKFSLFRKQKDLGLCPFYSSLERLCQDWYYC